MDWSKFTIMRIWIYLHLILNDHCIHKDFHQLQGNLSIAFCVLVRNCNFYVDLPSSSILIVNRFMVIFVNLSKFYLRSNIMWTVTQLDMISRPVLHLLVHVYSGKLKHASYLLLDKISLEAMTWTCVFRETKTCIIFVIGLDTLRLLIVKDGCWEPYSKYIE